MHANFKSMDLLERVGGNADFPTRRQFLRTCGRSAMVASPLALLACANQERTGESKASSASTTPDVTALTAELEKQLPALLAQAGTVPAVSMALVADGKLAWRGAFGVKDLESRAPIDHDTVFEAGSVSKTVFAYVVLKLCEKSVLDLDAPLTKYLPGRLIQGDPRSESITVRRVLSHTTGLQNWRSKDEPLAIQFTPGERWGYSGEGYSYLQFVVTQLVGRVDAKDCRTFFDDVQVCATDFDAWMRTSLLDPFGMTASGYLYKEGMARPHDGAGKMLGDRKATPVDAARYGSAGGLHTTPTDYAKFLVELLKPKPADAHRLSRDGLTEMVRPQVKVADSISWGLGWAIAHTNAGDVLCHSGDNPGYKAMAAASLSRKAGYIIMTNGDRGFDEVVAKVVKSEPMQAFLPALLI